MSFAIAVVGLGALVLVHEAGHFFASLALGMRPRKFYLGFPPAVLKTTRRGIEYGVGAIPLGGFVKIPGMHRPAPGDVDTHLARILGEAPDLGGPIERLRSALAAGDHDAARAALATVRKLVDERHLSDAVRKSAQKGIDDLGDALGPDAYWRAAPWKRVLVIAAGPVSNILLTIALLTGLLMTSGGTITTRVDRIVRSTPAAPAAVAGLRAGDTILAIDGTSVTAVDIPRRISASHGKPLVLTVVRDGRHVRIGPVSAQKDPNDGVYRIGFGLHSDGLGLAAATLNSFRITGRVTREIGSSLGHIVTGSGRKDISSPVGIVSGSSDAVKQGTDSYLGVLALISLSIALLNLLPLLPLDGGHIAFSLIEGVRGRAVAREVYERVSVVGIALVLLLFVIGLSNDIGHLS
jgi:regulator of sigma E protease